MAKSGDEKEIYRLWWNYLRESENYRVFCDAQKTKKGGAIWKIPEGKSYVFFFWYYGFFGDVYRKSFDDFWNWKKAKWSYRGVIDYAEIAQKDMELCVEFLTHEKQQKKLVEKGNVHGEVDPYDAAFWDEPRWSNGQFLCAPEIKPSLEEFIEFFPKYLEHPLIRDKFLVRVDLSFGSRIDLRNSFYELLKTNKNTKRNQTRWMQPIGKIHFKDLGRYLRVYQLKKKGLRLETIISELGTEVQKKVLEKRGPKLDDIIRNLKRDLRCARQIIKNVEQGQFPGRFRSTS